MWEHTSLTLTYFGCTAHLIRLIPLDSHISVQTLCLFVMFSTSIFPLLFLSAAAPQPQTAWCGNSCICKSATSPPSTSSYPNIPCIYIFNVHMPGREVLIWLKQNTYGSTALQGQTCSIMARTVGQSNSRDSIIPVLPLSFLSFGCLAHELKHGQRSDRARERWKRSNAPLASMMLIKWQRRPLS